MSISYLLSPNDYNLYCKDLSADSVSSSNFTPENLTTTNLTSQSIELTNTSTYVVNLLYFSGLGYDVVAPGIEIKCTLFDRFVYLEIPEITVSLPTGYTSYFLSQSLNATEIFFPFSFKYNSYGSGYVNNTQINQTNPMFYRVFVGNNSPIQLNKVDNTAFTNGTTRFIPTVLTFVRDV